LGEDTNYDNYKLYWNNRKYELNIPIGKTDNVFTFPLAAPGYNKFNLFCQRAEIDYDKSMIDPIICQEAGVVSDDKDDHETQIVPATKKPKHQWWSRNELPISCKLEGAQAANPTPTSTSFDLDAWAGLD
jgi:hypothetical protein